MAALQIVPQPILTGGQPPLGDPQRLAVEIPEGEPLLRRQGMGLGAGYAQGQIPQME